MVSRRRDEARVIKKYGNRRLYDTEDSRYITLEDLTERVRNGADVRVVDASTGDDLTRVTLTQLLIEGRGAGRFLSVPLLLQLLRMDNDALAEFFGRHVAQSLEWYARSRGVARAIAPVNPIAMAPFAAADAFARWMASGWGPSPAMPPSVAYAEPAPPVEASAAPTPLPAPPDASTRAELDALRDELRRLREDLTPAPAATSPAPRVRRARPRKRPRSE